MRATVRRHERRVVNGRERSDPGGLNAHASAIASLSWFSTARISFTVPKS